MEEEKLRAVYYARCSTEEENQKDALVTFYVRIQIFMVQSSI